MMMSMNIKRDMKAILAKGFLVVEKTNNPTLISFRRGRCHDCPSGLYDKKNDECTGCDCIVEEKIKSITHKTLKMGLPIGPIIKGHCPNGHWLDKEVANHYRAEKGLELIT